MYWIIREALTPPMSLVLVGLFALWLARLAPRWGWRLAAAAFLALYALATPFVSAGLLRMIEVPSEIGPAEAIVVLSAGLDRSSTAPDGADADGLTMVRLRRGVQLHRDTGLPVLVAGGTILDGVPPVSFVMARIMRDEYGVTPQWVEARSTTTAENAEETARILAEAGITRVILVTHGWHMPRARYVFEKAGLMVLPGSAGLREAEPLSVLALIPSAEALLDSHYALHELIGYVVYRLAA